MKNGHVMACPHCGSPDDIKKNGTKDGKQRYFCKRCRKTFNENVGTLFQHSKLSSEQMYGLIKGMLLNLSLSQIADDTGLSIKSVHFNRKKICNALQELFPEQDKELTGLVECDEYMARLSFKGKRDAAFFVNVLGRLPKHNRSLAEKLEYLEKNDLLEDLKKDPDRLEALLFAKGKHPGKFKEQVSILTCKDNNENLYINPVCIGKMENNHAFKHLGPIINKDAIMITDKYLPYLNFAEMYNIRIEQILSTNHVSGEFNLSHINALHSRLMARFWSHICEHSPATKYLDLELTLFWWMEKNKGKSIDEKVLDIYNHLFEQFYDRLTYHSMTHREFRLDTKGLIPQVV